MVKGARRCTSEGSDVRTCSTVKVRERHVIDRGAGRGTVYEEHMEHLGTV